MTRCALLSALPQVEAGAADPFWQITSLSVEMASSPLAETLGQRDNSTLHISVSLRRSTPVLHHVLLAPFVGQHHIHITNGFGYGFS